MKSESQGDLPRERRGPSQDTVAKLRKLASSAGPGRAGDESGSRSASRGRRACGARDGQLYGGGRILKVGRPSRARSSMKMAVVLVGSSAGEEPPVIERLAERRRTVLSMDAVLGSRAHRDGRAVGEANIAGYRAVLEAQTTSIAS